MMDLDLIANLAIIGLLGSVLAAIAVALDMLPEPHA